MGFFVHAAKKKAEMFAVFKKVYTFAASYKGVRCDLWVILFYGVMVAQQILVLFVQVRILVVQLK